MCMNISQIGVKREDSWGMEVNDLPDIIVLFIHP